MGRGEAREREFSDQEKADVSYRNMTTSRNSTQKNLKITSRNASKGGGKEGGGNSLLGKNRRFDSMEKKKKDGRGRKLWRQMKKGGGGDGGGAIKEKEMDVLKKERARALLSCDREGRDLSRCLESQYL